MLVQMCLNPGRHSLGSHHSVVGGGVDDMSLWFHDASLVPS